MRLDRDAFWRAVTAPGRPPTRTEARAMLVCLLLQPVSYLGLEVWKPLSVLSSTALVVAYLCWRLRTVLAPFFPDWQRRAAVIAGWPPRLHVTAYTVLWLAGLALVVASWVT